MNIKYLCMQISVPGYVLHCESFNTNLAAVPMKKYTKDPAFVVQLNQYRQHKTNVITFNMCKMYTGAPIKWGKKLWL